MINIPVFWDVRPCGLKKFTDSSEKHLCVEIKCQLDAKEVFFIADLIACSTCFGHHYAHHQELKSIIQWLLPVVFRAVVFSSSWSGVELRVMRPVCRMQHPASSWLFISTY